MTDHSVGRMYVPTGGDDEAHYYWIYPNWMLNAYVGQMQTNIVLPIDHQTTLVRFDWYALGAPGESERGPEWTKISAFADQIQDEDVAICEAVQKNLRSRVYDRGRYSAKREIGVHHFHSLLHESLT